MFEKLKLPVLTEKDLERQLKIALFNFYNPSRYEAILKCSSELLKSIPNEILDNIDLDYIIIPNLNIDDKGELY